MSLKLDPTLDIICIKSSFKYWLINRFSKTDYAANKDPVVGKGDNIRCNYDSGIECKVGNPQGVYRAIKSPGVRGNEAGYCNATYCKMWTPQMILDRLQITSDRDLPPRLIILDYITKGPRMASTLLLQLTVASVNTQDDPGSFKLDSLRNSLVEALDYPDPPTAKNIPLYKRSDKGKMRFTDSYKTPITLTMTPSGDERMSRPQTNPQTTRGDRSSFAQSSMMIGEYTFTFMLAICQQINGGGAFA